MMSNSESRKREMAHPPLAPAGLSAAEREDLAAAVKDSFYEARDSGRTMHQAAEDSRIFVGVERILASRLAAQREQDEELAREYTKIALATQRKLIATEIEEAIEPDHEWPSDWQDCFEIGVNRAVALVRGGAR